MVNKSLAVICLLLLLSASLMAQSRFFPSRPRNDAALYEGPVYGLKGGVNIPRLYYTEPNLASLPHDLMITPSSGFFVEIPFLRPCTIAPELNYQVKGGSFSYSYAQHIKEVYELRASFVSLRIPLFFYMPITDRVKPYVFLGPDFGFAIMGDIALTHPNHEIPDQALSINPSNFKYAYWGALGGVGIRFNLPLSLITIVVKADAALNWGLRDTYSRHEHGGVAIPLNVNVYDIQGKRYSGGLELHLSLGYFINKYDACGSFNSN